MIPKIPNSRSQQSSFKHSIGYVIDSAKQEDADTQLVNVLSERTAAVEMAAIARLNHRVNDPVFHAILSWPSHETPDRAAIFASADHALTTLGFDLSPGGHSAVYSIHRDTANIHVHLIANRIHPTTGLAVDLWQSQQRLHKACRELELQHHWTPSPGSWVIKDGAIVRATRSDDRTEHPTERDIRAQIGQSFGDYVRSAGQSKLIQTADSWPAYHAALHHFNLVIQPRGGGFVIRDITHPERYHSKGGVLGSRYKAAALIERFGPYQPDTQSHTAAILHYIDPRQRPDQPHRTPRDPARTALRKAGRQALYDAYRRDKADHIVEQKTLKQHHWDQQRQREKARWQSHLAHWRQYRKDIMNDTPKGKKRLISSLLAFEKAQDKHQLDQQRRQERQALKDQFNSAESFPNWRHWVRAQASQGDPIAISVYRGLRYRQRNDNQFVAAQLTEQSSEHSSQTPGFHGIYAMEMTQGIGFWKDQTHFATDYGQGVTVHDIEQDSIELAYRIALEKWGGHVAVEGSERFIKAATTIAHTMGMSLPQHHTITPSETDQPRPRMQ